MGDKASQGAFVDLEQPIGQKAEKDKRKTKEKKESENCCDTKWDEDKKMKIKLFEEPRDHDKEMLCLK